MFLKKKKPQVHIWLRLFCLFLIVIGLTVLFYQTGLVHIFIDKERLVAFFKKLGQPLSAPAIFAFVLLQASQVVVAPIPGEATGILGGILYGPYLGVLLSTIGLTLGSYIAFTLARVFGRPFAEKFVSKHTMRRFDYLLHHKGAFLIFLLFLIPGFPKDSLCYVLGLGHLTTAEFLVIGGTGRLFGTVLLTLGGNYLRHKQYVEVFVLAGAAIIVIFVTMVYREQLERLFRRWHIIRYKKRKKERMNQKGIADDQAP